MKKLASLLTLILVILLGLLAWLVFGTKSELRVISVSPTNSAAAISDKTFAPKVPVTAPTGAAVLSTLNSQPSTPPPPSAPDLAARAASPAPVPTDIPDLPPLTVLDNARVAIHNYHDRFGENPVGNNAEITAALLGKNPKQVNFLTAESGLRVNDQGEMLDAWGTPFFFHQLSGYETEIRSAGEDKKMWSFDDLLTR